MKLTPIPFDDEDAVLDRLVEVYNGCVDATEDTDVLFNERRNSRLSKLLEALEYIIRGEGELEDALP